MSDSPPQPLPDATSGSGTALDGLIARAWALDGRPPFSDGALVEFARGARELVWEYDADGHPVAAALDSPSAAEFVVVPDARGRGHGARMLDMLTHPSRGGHTGAKLFWAHGDHPASRALAAHHKLAAVRELWHMTGAVPAPAAAPPAETSTSVGSAAAKATEGDTSASSSPAVWRDTWVALNAVVFAAHPEQGRITRDDLDVIAAEPWFNADDVLLAWDGDTLVGYNWLKVEGLNAGSAERAAAEIYVIGVHPDRQGEGVGRALMEAGFARMRQQGIHSMHLYVDADNLLAIALYESLGFAKVSADIQYHYTR